MLKKYKILGTFISVVLLGILTILGVWLYGIYKNKQENLVSEIDRALFNVVQNYYQSNLDARKKQESRPSSGIRKLYLDEIVNLYPNIDRNKIEQLWDSLKNERDSVVDNKYRGWSKSKSAENRTMLPYFLMQGLEFKEGDLIGLQKAFSEALSSKGINVDVYLDTVYNASPPTKRSRYEILDNGDIKGRSLLLNPELHLTVQPFVVNPTFHIFGRMLWQLLMSVILMMALCGTFAYLLLTINRQNRMAVLRKSFVNNMTHELKTPVATVMAAVEAIQRYGARDDKAKMEKYLAMSHRELEHLSDMIERVLQLDMDQVNGISLDRINFDLISLLNECIETAKISSQKPIHIDFIKQDNAVLFFGDPAHMKNVFNNLLDNAVKYSKQEVKISIEISTDTRNIKILIADQGIGMESKYLKDVFDMFFRVPHGNVHTVKGFGLGLSYVKQIIQRHGGAIYVRSTIDKGTEFEIILQKASS